jgi:cytochrome c
MSVRLLAAAGLLTVLTACGPAAEKPAPPPVAAPAAPAPAPAPPPAASADDPAITAALAELPAPYNGANYANGRKVLAQCRTCHTVVKGGPNQVGPNLHGLFGRTAGTAEKFAYSAAVKGSGIVWDAQKLDQWLADPKGFLPGNRMAFAGVRKPDDRRDVIAYLKIESAK